MRGDRAHLLFSDNLINQLRRNNTGRFIKSESDSAAATQSLPNFETNPKKKLIALNFRFVPRFFRRNGSEGGCPWRMSVAAAGALLASLMER